MGEEIALRYDDLVKIDEMLQFTIQRRELDINDPSNIQFKPIETKYNVDPFKYSSFFKIESINKNEDDIHSGLKAVRQILNLFRDGRNSFIFILSSTKNNVTLSIGTLPAPGNDNIQELKIQKEIFKKALYQTNYGIEFSENISYSHIHFDNITKHSEYIACITGIPGVFTEEDKNTNIRIDDLINATLGEEYTLIGILEPIPLFILDELIMRCNDIRSAASNIAKISFQLGKSITLSRSFSNSYSNSQNYNYGEAWGESKGYSFNFGGIAGVIGGLIGFLSGGPIGSAVGAALGAGLFGGYTKNKNSFRNQNRTWGESYSKSFAETIGESESSSENITREFFNKSAERTDKIAQNLIERFEIGKERGMWDTGIYLFANKTEVVRSVANVIRSNISGYGSRLEPVRINILEKDKMDTYSYNNFIHAIHYLRNPKAYHAGHPFGVIYEGLSTPLTGEEVPIVFNFPRYDVKGIKVIRRAKYLPEVSQNIEKSDIPLGFILDGAKKIEAKTYIKPKNFKHHFFICGVTGSGKTVTCLNILVGLIERNPEVKFLVIEPAKNHYRSLFSKYEKIKIYTLGNEKSAEKILSFRYNPFYPVRLKYQEKFKISNLQAHIDFIKSAIISALPMEVAMPAILSEAITKSYIDYGWDLKTSTNIHFQDIEKVEDISDYIPTLIDVRENIDLIIDQKGFDKRLNMDYKGALKARIDGLCDGAKGIMLNTRKHIEIDKILEENTILELDNIPDPSEKAIIIGFIMGAIYEYRKLEKQYKNDFKELKHVTLIEEAHHLLTNFKATENQEIAASRSKLVEVFANILSEIRAYGEGFIIVEQIPSKLLGDVIKNTSTKIVHKIIDGEERKLLASSLVLTKEQEDDLPFLKQGECIYLDENLHSPQKIKVDFLEIDEFQRESYIRLNNDFDSFFSINQKNLIYQNCKKFNIDINDVLKVLVTEYNNINFEAINPFNIVRSFIYKILISDCSLIDFEKYINKINPIISKRELCFVTTDKNDLSKALAWAFAFTEVIRGYIVSLRKKDIADAVIFCKKVEELFVEELFNNFISNECYKSIIREELKNNSIVKKPVFDYVGCEQCEFKCNYGLFIPQLLDTISMNKKLRDGSPINYHNYLKKIIINNFNEDSENHINEMLFCLISTFSEYNIDVFNKLKGFYDRNFDFNF